MDIDIIKTVIKDYQRRVVDVEVQQRGMVFEPSGNYVLVGLRRAGKSYTLYQNIQKRINCGLSEKADILYVNFEDDRLGYITMSDLDGIMRAYGEMYPDRKPVIYLDEVQIVAGWEKFARRLADTGYQVFITGSNAYMLSSEIATTLGGRFIIRHIHPFSFREYLEYKGILLEKDWQFDNHVSTKVRSLFGDYFHFGGFAEHFSRADKREWISGLCQKILLGDIIARNEIRNPALVRLLVRKLAESVMQPSTQTRLLNILKSTGASVSRNTVSGYLEYLEDAFMVFSLTNYTDSLSEQVNNRKRYFSDNGLLNNYLVDPETKLLENLVAVTLRRLYDNDGDQGNLYYYNKGIEVDFYVPSENMAIQVSYNIRNEETLRHEVGALLKMSKTFDLKELVVITMDTEDTIMEDGREIQVVPVWKWLLEQDV